MKNLKRQQIIQTGLTLFWKFGIRRVTVEEICREARVSKMTFYKNFKNKIDLVKSIIDKMTEERMAQYHSIMAKNVPFREKVNLSIQMKMEQTNDLSQEFYLDIHKHATPELKAHIDKKMQQTVHLVLKDYINAQKKGDIRKDIKPEFILYFLNHMRDMVNDRSLTDLYDSPQALIMELTRFFFYGVMPRDEMD